MKKTKNKNKPKLFHCFACKQKKQRSEIARSGTRENKTHWHVCRECHAVYKQERELDKQAYRAAQGDMRVGEKGSESMGWNGVPSGRSLRARKR